MVLTPIYQYFSNIATPHKSDDGEDIELRVAGVPIHGSRVAMLRGSRAARRGRCGSYEKLREKEIRKRKKRKRGKRKKKGKVEKGGKKKESKEK